MPPRESSRRSFLTTAGVFAVSIPFVGCRSPQKRRLSANEKLNIGVIGVGNRGAENLAGVEGENIVALCDVDAKVLGTTAQKFPRAKTFSDFRRLLDEKGIDAIVISTPDHTHAVATSWALKSGRHTYCEKPLTHTISEARFIRQLARRTGLATQLGTQIHATENYRRVVELVESGAIGSVKEVHVWVDRAYKWSPPRLLPVPAHLDYESWIGPIPYQPYSPDFVPFNWRNFWSFGGGALADFSCHHMDLSKWALQLGPPVSVEAEGPPVDPRGVPPWMIARYEFPARGRMPPVRMTWYQGGKRPPHFSDGRTPKWGDGTLFVGDKGMLLASYSAYKLLPEADSSYFKPPSPRYPKSIGHHAEWILACKTGAKTSCNFEYGGELTETGLLGNAAFRAGEKLFWDGPAMKASTANAMSLIHHQYKKGWKL